jgi:peptidoglycan/LPS O-acetylase OafA/YrhL
MSEERGEHGKRQEGSPSPFPPAPQLLAEPIVAEPQTAGSHKASVQRLACIDGMRGMAILLVLFAHFVPGGLQENSIHSMPARLLERFYGSGVELFCLISGLVLLRPFFRRLKPFNLKNYAARRVKRLWPPYLVALLLAAPMVWLTTTYPTYFSASMPYTAFRWSDWLSQIFMINWGTPLYNPTWWFLSIEVVFYALGPLFAVLAYRNEVSQGAMWVILALSFLMGELAYRLLQNNFQGHHLAYQVVLFGSYIPCYVAGMAVAKLDLNRGDGVGSDGHRTGDHRLMEHHTGL